MAGGLPHTFDEVAAHMRFEIYKDKAGDWRWRARATNGLIVADSGEAYVSKWNAKRAVKALLRNVEVLA